MTTVFESGSLIYVAHRFMQDHTNLDKVERLVSWLNERYNCLFYAPWVPTARYSSKHVEWQMQRDFEWLRMSSGMFIFNAVGSTGVARERVVSLEYHGAGRILDFGGLQDIEHISLYYQNQLELYYGRRTG